MKPIIASLCLAMLSAQMGAWAAEPTPADRKAFVSREKMYLSFEVTLTGSGKTQSNPSSGINASGTWRVNRSVKGELPLEMAIPGQFPPSSMPKNPAELMEEGRFIGWMPRPPSDEQMDSGAMGETDPTKNPMYFPVEFMVDDEMHNRTEGETKGQWLITDTTTKGRGKGYMQKTGLVACDLKAMVCEVSGILVIYTDGKDLVTTSGTSNDPDHPVGTQTTESHLLVPKVSQALGQKLAGLKLSLPGVVTWTASDSPEWPAASSLGLGSSQLPSVLAIKLTLSPTPMPKPAAAPR